MHNARPNVDHKALLVVAVSRCSMRVCFSPNMTVVAAENPLSGDGGIIREKHQCGKVGLLCILVHKATNKLVSTKVIVGA